MGAGSSKETPNQSQHVFAADTPVRFSQSVIDSLQNSPETDSTRSRNLELQVQTRVTAELEKIRDQESQRLSLLSSQLTPTEDNSQTEDKPSLGSKIASAVSGDGASKQSTSDSVRKEIDGLKAKLDKRHKLEEPDKGVERAKDQLVACLRMNDRRPLDCYQEVAAFKAEVGRLERAFVERTMR